MLRWLGLGCFLQQGAACKREDAGSRTGDNGGMVDGGENEKQTWVEQATWHIYIYYNIIYIYIYIYIYI